MFQIVSASAQIFLLMTLSSCGTTHNEMVDNDATHQGAAMTPANNATGNDADASVATRFRSLDAYLEWLRTTQAPVDGSWYEEVGDGLYRLNTGNLRILTTDGDATPAPQTFTRAELEKKFGFAR